MNGGISTPFRLFLRYLQIFEREMAVHYLCIWSCLAARYEDERSSQNEKQRFFRLQSAILAIRVGVVNYTWSPQVRSTIRGGFYYLFLSFSVDIQEEGWGPAGGGVRAKGSRVLTVPLMGVTVPSKMAAVAPPPPPSSHPYLPSPPSSATLFFNALLFAGGKDVG